jgi:hypothetical protein
MGDITGLMAVIMTFGTVIAIVVLPSYFRTRERLAMQDTLRSAIDKGQPLPPEVIEAMSKRVKAPSSRVSDLRRGVIWLAVGIGIAAMAGAVSWHEGDDAFPMFGIAAIPAAIGLAFIVLSFFNPNKGEPA